MIQNTARRAPHQGTPQQYAPPSPNAALLIDFDNVTMGIRSDLGKEMKALLNSEVIRGKVAVQRAYADWRRYPQYIVPLAESSIDLIFAPAYGSAKKNATDLRMAIDAIELVFTRPEIGTFILMTGDSDFSSCVLKLKEYGKYVIGVGMRESSSDLLIQNCDEYYSYHALSGLTRSDEVVESKEDPWVLLKRAAQQMVKRGDVMRTDRLKQVMLELDPGFDEKAVGYSKFSRFVQEASTKGLIKLRKGENGQYEIVVEEAAGDGAGASAAAVAPAETPASREDADGRRRGGRGRGRGRERDREERRPEPIAAAVPEAAALEAAAPAEPASEPTRAPEPTEPAAEPARATTAAPTESGPVRNLEDAYGLLQLAMRDLVGNGGKVRDGDVKRKMLELSPGFDEGVLGFSKFTRFLRQAHDAEAIDLERVNGGNYEVSLPASGKRYTAPTVVAAVGTPAAKKERKPEERKREERQPSKAEPKSESRKPDARAQEPKPEAAVTAAAEPAQQPAKEEQKAATPSPSASGAAAVSAPPRRGVGAVMRRGGRSASGAEGPPPILPGQAVGTPKPTAAEAQPREQAPEEATAPAAVSAAPEAAPEETKSRSRRGGRGRGRKTAAADAAVGPETASSEAASKPERKADSKPEATAAEPVVEAPAATAKGTRKRGSTKKAAAPDTPAKKASRTSAAKPAEEPAKKPATRRGAKSAKSAEPAAKPAARAASAPSFDAAAFGLPTDRAGMLEYLATAYKGVGRKTAESLVEAFGEDVFRVMRDEPDRVRAVVGPRAKALMEQWDADLAGRAPAAAAEPAAQEKKPSTRRGSRGGRGRKKEPAAG